MVDFAGRIRQYTGFGGVCSCKGLPRNGWIMRLWQPRTLGTYVQIIRRVVVAAATAACVCLPACTPRQYAGQADRAAYGLIEDKQTDTIKKIPLLGDIPVAGHLFKRTIKEKTKTELLIFLTPHVAMDAGGLTPISEAERDRSILNTDKTAAEIFKKHMKAMDTSGADANEP